MAGAILDRKLTVAPRNSVEFAVAEQLHDGGIRRLLRDNPTRGNISLSFTREPDYFADSRGAFGEKQTIVATRGDKVVCVGSCLTRMCYVNGHPKRVGYLGALRLDEGMAGQFSVLRRGYEFFREVQRNAPADFYFTSIASDNLRARKFLEARIAGMPMYEFIGEYVTLVAPTKQRVRREHEVSLVSNSNLPRHFVNRYNSEFQFAPCWSEEEELSALADYGLEQRFQTVSTADGLIACAKLWDQRSFKQTVIHSYSLWMKIARPMVNLLAPLLAQPHLPTAGTILREAYVSGLACNAGNAGALLSLVTALMARAAENGCPLLVLGFAAENPFVQMLIRRLNCRQYRSRLYVVRWRDLGGDAGQLDGRCVGPEVAFL